MTAYRIKRPDTAFSLTPTRRQKKPRVYDDAHLAWIRTLPCLVSGTRMRVEAAHIRYADPYYGKQESGLGRKSDDCWVVPLEAALHADQHKHGEREWWQSKGINPVHVALLLYMNSGDDEQAEQILRRAREK